MSYLHEVPPDEQASATFKFINDSFGFIPNFFREQTMRSDLIDTEVQLMGAICSKRAL